MMTYRERTVRLTGIMLTAMLTMATAEIQVQIAEPPVDAGQAKPTLNVPPPEDATDASSDNEVTLDVIEFMNLDKLHGSLLGVGGEEARVSWQHQHATDRIAFGVPAVSGIKLAPRQSGGGASSAHAAIHLTNEDELRGQIVSLDTNQLVLDTWYAGRMTIERPMVKAILPNASVSSLIFSGPTDIANWTIGRRSSRGTWTFKKGSFVTTQSNSPIGKNIDDMPDMARIEFTARWQGYPSFYFAFFTDNLERYYGNCYMLQASGSSVHLQRYTRNGNNTSLGNINVQQFNSGASSRARFTLLVNKKKRVITLLLDGVTTKTWEDAGTFAGLGNGILFQSQSGNRLRISDISVAEWDGEPPREGSTDVEVTEDLVRFTNRDKVSGRLASIENGNVKFVTTYATMDIPISRVAEFVFSAEESERARRNKTDVRCTFAGDGQVTFGLTEISDVEVKGYSENFGDITAPLAAFNYLEFNVYAEKQDNSEDDF